MRDRMRFGATALALLFFAAVSANSETASDRVELSPRLQRGQVFVYQISVRNNKKVKTESNVTAPMAPEAPQVFAHGLLRVEIADAQPEGSRSSAQVRTRFITLDSTANSKDAPAGTPPSDELRADADSGEVDFGLASDGRMGQVIGFDALKPEQQQAWQEWAERFAVSASFPQRGLAQGEKWKADEPVSSPTQIAGLIWQRNSQYVHDEPCPNMKMTVSGDIVSADDTSDVCAVVLTTARLDQHSSIKDSTPDDYKLHDLRTMGVAKGRNEIITYISLRTGVVVRATEDANQFMDVVVAKSDGSNRVHYTVNADSHAQVLLIGDTPLLHP
jgi:hypothetical protein